MSVSPLGGPTPLPEHRPWWPRRLRGWRGGALAALAAVTVVVLVLSLLGRLPGMGGGSAAAASASSSTGGSTATGSLPSPAPAAAVLEPVADTAPVPTAAGLTAALAPLLADKALGPHVGAAVVDLSTGRLLFGQQAAGGFSTASTTKLLTAVAALSVLGPDYRIRTRVVAGATAGQVVLVGAGDPTLATVPPPGFVPAPASLPDLARATATALKAAGRTTVTLGYDSTLFTGSPTAATWPSSYVTSGVVAPVTALAVDEGRVGLIAEGTAPRVPNPALGAARAFARQLARQGITVTGAPVATKAPATPAGGAPSPGASASSLSSPTSPTSTRSGSATSSSGSSGSAAATPAALVPGTVLGSVTSPALSDLLGWMLSTSDNDLAEALAHLLAIESGQPADFPGGVSAVLGGLRSLGLPTDSLGLYDGSGLSTQTRVEPRLLGQVLSLAASPEHPQLRSLLTGLAVAGFTGSLEPPRFDGPGTTAAAGMVRGKTGTLTGVSAIAGTVQDVSGRTLAFVFVADRVPAGGTLPARGVLDRLAASVAGCGCAG